jgi:hypothetical protein
MFSWRYIFVAALIAGERRITDFQFTKENPNNKNRRSRLCGKL